VMRAAVARCSRRQRIDDPVGPHAQAHRDATAAFLQHCATIYARLSLNHRQQPRGLYNSTLD
jgi:hypothetical protein